MSAAGIIEIQKERQQLEEESDSSDSEKEAAAASAPLPIEIVIMTASDPDVGASLTDSMMLRRRGSLAGRRKSLAQLELKEKLTERTLRGEFEDDQKEKDAKIASLKSIVHEAQGSLDGSIREFREKDNALIEELNRERDKVTVLTKKLNALQRYVEDKEREFLEKRMAEIDEEEAIIAGIKPRRRRGSRAGLGQNTKSDEDLTMREEDASATTPGHGSASMAAAMFDLPIFTRKRDNRDSNEGHEGPRSVSAPPVRQSEPRRPPSVKVLAPKRKPPKREAVSPAPKASRRAQDITARLYKTPKEAGIHSRVARAEQDKRMKLRDAAEEKRRQEALARRAAASSPFSSQGSLSRASPVSSRGSSPSEATSPVPVDKSSTVVQLRRGGSRTVSAPSLVADALLTE